MILNKFLLASIALVYSSHALAYLDPGTGSLIIQGLLGAFAVAAVAIRTYWYKIQSFFGRKRSSSLLDDEDNKDD